MKNKFPLPIILTKDQAEGLKPEYFKDVIISDGPNDPKLAVVSTILKKIINDKKQNFS